MTINITDDEFDQTINSNPLVLVDFWAEWCTPCKILSPLLEEVSNDDLVIAKVNIEENQNTPQKYGVRSIPTLLMFKDGELVGSQFTTRTMEQLTSFIDQHH